MNHFFQYFMIELKRNIRMFPTFIGSILILIDRVDAGLFLAGFVLKENQVFDTVTVDFVIHEEEKEIRLAAVVLENMESVKSICEFSYTTEAEARENMKTGKADMAILINENFYENMDTGVNAPAILLVSEQADFNTEVFRELITAGVSLIQTTEAAVYAVLDAGEVYETKVSYEELQELIFYRYVEKILSRNRIFQKNLLLATGEYDLTEYYFAGGLILCVLASCMNFGFLYGKSEQTIEELLYVYGLSKRKTAIAKIMVMGLVLSITVFLLLGIAGLVCSMLGKELFTLNIVSSLGIFLIALSMAAMNHMIYSIGREKGTVFVFFLLIVMVMCSGIILPMAYFPEIIQEISKINPMIYWADHMRMLLFDEMQWKTFGMELLLITAGIMAGTVRINVTAIPQK